MISSKKERRFRIMISAIVFTVFVGMLSCTTNSEVKILHLVPYGFEGVLVARMFTDTSISFSKVNDQGFLEVAYSGGYGVLNQVNSKLWSQEKILWRKSNGELVDSVQFVNLGIRTEGLETIFLVVKKGKSKEEIRRDLRRFLSEKEVDLDWKPTGGKYPLGPRREYFVKGNNRYWYDK